MKRFGVMLVSVLLAFTAAAQEKKSDSKKSDKAKAKAAQKSDKNVFQKAESDIGDWAHRNKIWVRSGKSEKK
jgi:hypothetical protein